MSASSFNILTATRSLESTGVPRAQAERITDTVQQAMEALIANLATKGDLAASQAETRASIDTLRAQTQASIDTLRAETKADIGTLRAKVEALEEKMATKTELAEMKAELFRALWLQSIGILTGVGVLLTLFRMF